MLLALYLLVLSPSLCVPLRLCASALRQGTLRGQVVNGTAGGGPTASLAVTLRAFRGDQESQRLAATADALGQFHFAHLETDADWAYQVQVTYQGVTYSGGVLSFAAGQDEIATEIAVYETTDSAERIGIERAHILITPSDRDREASAGLSVAEFYVFANPTDRTYVGTQEMEGRRWVSRFSLPPGSHDLAFDDGAPGGRFLAVEGGFVDTGPLWPGSTRVLFSYVLDCPAGDCDLSRQILYPIANLNVLLPDAGMQVAGSQLTLEGRREAQGQRYLNYAGHDLAPGGMLDLHVRLSPVPSLLAPSSLGDARALLWIILGSLAAALVLAYPFWQQRRISQAAAQGKE